MLFLCFRPKLWFKTFWDTFFFYPNLNVNKEGYWQATQRPGGVVLKDMRVRLKSCLRASRRTGGVCFDDVLLRLHHRLHVHTLSSAYRRATLWVLFINHSQIEDIYGMTHTHTHTPCCNFWIIRFSSADIWTSRKLKLRHVGRLTSCVWKGNMTFMLTFSIKSSQ